MPSGGQNRKSIAEHKMQGTYRKDRHSTDGESAGSAPEGEPEKPDWLDDVASAEWDRMVGVLRGMYPLSPVYGPAIAIHCVEFSRWLRASDTIEREGTTIQGPRGGSPKPHPSLRERRDAESAMRWFAQHFGLTPASRQRLGITDPPRSNEPSLSDFAAGKTVDKAKYFPNRR